MSSMRIVDEACAENLVPGLKERFSGVELTELEGPDNPGIEFFRALGGGNLLIPRELGGVGASPVEAMRTMSVLGSYAPSTAVAMVQHMFSIGALLPAWAEDEGVRELLRAIAANKLLVASPHAEGRGIALESPQMVAVDDKDGYRLVGQKNPVSLSKSMDLMLLICAYRSSPELPYRRMHAVVAAASEGITREETWQTPVFGGCQNARVRFNHVFVPREAVEINAEPGRLTPQETRSVPWFLLLACGLYIGIASRLVAQIFSERRGTAAERALLVAQLQTGLFSLEALGAEYDGRDFSQRSTAGLIATRYNIEDMLGRVSVEATRLLGGYGFFTSRAGTLLLGAIQCLSFHPPRRRETLEALDAYYAGAPLLI